MPTCLNCGANLAPEWKFCIYCGTVVATVSPRRRSTRDGDGNPRGATIPPAIRPEPVTSARTTRLDVPLLIGIVLGLAGTALIVYLAIELFGPK